jgi:hypothetical protein
MMDEFEMQEVLQDSLEHAAEDEHKIKHIMTFQRAGLLTRNKGLVLTLHDGSEFQVTIVQSKFADEEDE